MCWCPARSAGATRSATPSGSPGWRSAAGLFPVFEAEHGEVTAVTPIRRQVPVHRLPQRPERATRTCSPEPPQTDIIDAIQAIADRNIAPARPARERPETMMEKPFASRWTCGPSLANKTGSWRSERPVYVDRCRRATTPVPPGKTSRQWLYAAEDGDGYEGAWRAHHDGQPVPRRHGSGLLPPLRDRVQPRPARRARSASTRSSASSATKPSGAGWQRPGRSPHRPARPRRRRRAGRPVRRLPARPARPRGGRPRDAAPQAGGMMRVRHTDDTGCPRDIVDAEIERIRGHGRHASSSTRRWRTSPPAMPTAASTPCSSRRSPARQARSTYPPAEASEDPRCAHSCCVMTARASSPSWAGGSSSTAAVTRPWTRPGRRGGSAHDDAIVVYRRTRERMPAHESSSKRQ